MNLPFTVEQFLGVFVAYNSAIWPLQPVAYAIGLIALMAVFRKWAFASRIVLTILAIMWAVNGIGYHYLFFTAINPAASLFAALFVVQSLLFAASAAITNGLVFDTKPGVATFAGGALLFYAMVIYPLLGIWAGHGLMKGPMFGVAPCPTTIFTIGILLLARGKLVVWLSVVPLLWSLVGLAAAIQLRIHEDFGLSIAGIALLLAIGARTVQARLGHGDAAP